ncbi:P-loop containing nucleoside triphosphate hydrolase protein [Blastocladiella britannica]|nr:P-loop containing nucleoside triphosphate hydrolase protein [Blastocladiella britannica]
MAKSTKSDRKKSDTAAPPSIVAQIQANSGSSDDSESKTQSKKDKKRKRETTTAAVVEEPEQAQEEVEEDLAPKPKKAKKAAAPASAAAVPKSANGEWTFVERPEVANMEVETVQKYYEDHHMTIVGHDGECFKPLLEFDHAGLPTDVMGSLKGFDKPTPIQAASWPIALRNRDLIAIAETGSGKTLGFTIPALVHIKNTLLAPKKRAANAPVVLVVLPTRELAMQVHAVAEEAGKACNVRSVCVYGGMPKHEQAYALTAHGGAHFVVGTPGRLVDMAINDGTIDLSQVSMVVLDEADRMLDLGFEKDVRALLSAAKDKNNRQTLMFSATWPVSVRKLANEFLVDAVKLTIGDDELAASHTVTQVVEVLADRDNNGQYKERRLVQLLKQYQGNKKQTKVLVFALYKKEAQRLEDLLRRQGYTVEGIHGDKNQGSRTAALQRFRDGTAPIMVATDVAARGLDIPNVEVVINVTFPLTIEDYVHRIGRTGRAGKSGISHTLFTVTDKSHSGELINVLRQANQAVPDDLLKYGTTVKRKEHSAYGAFFKSVDTNVTATKITFDSDDE